MWASMMRAAAPDPQEDESSETSSQQQQQQQQQHQPASTPLGAGLVGRFTRFVENVTTEEYYDDDDGEDGWEEDDDIDYIDDDDDDELDGGLAPPTAAVATTDTPEQPEQVVQDTATTTTTTTSAVLPPESPSSTYATGLQEQDTWQHDDDDEGLPSPSTYASVRQHVEDMHDAEGWGEEDDVLNDLSENHPQEATTSPTTTTTDPLSLTAPVNDDMESGENFDNKDPVVSPEVEGWDDDDDVVADIDVSEEDNVANIPVAAEPEKSATEDAAVAAVPVEAAPEGWEEDIIDVSADEPAVSDTKPAGVLVPTEDETPAQGWGHDDIDISTDTPPVTDKTESFTKEQSDGVGTSANDTVPPTTESQLAVGETGEGWDDDGDIEVSERNDQEEETGEGWDDGDIEVSERNDEDEVTPVEPAPPATEETGEGWDEDGDIEVSERNDNDEVSPVEPAPPAAEETGEGWDDDGDIEVSERSDKDEVSPVEPAPPAAEETGEVWDDGDIEVSERNDPPAASQVELAPPAAEETGEGWDDDDDIEVSERNDAEGVSPVEPTPPATEEKGEGWDDDGDLEVSQRNDAEGVSPVEHTSPEIEETGGGRDDDDNDIGVSEHNDAEAVSPVEPRPEIGGWDDDLDVSGHAEPPMAEAPSSPGAPSATEAPPVAEEGWGEDLDVSENDLADAQTQQAAPSPLPPTSPFPPPTSPQPVSKEADALDNEVKQASQNLQAVLDEISHQEAREKRAFACNISCDTADSALIDDDFHAQQAVSDIQREMDLFHHEQNSKGRHNQKPSIVDHTPATRLLSASDPDVDDNPSIAVLANADDRSRDTGPMDNKSDARSGMSLTEEQDIFDNENEMAYGPVVDHLPKPSEFMRQDSLAVQGGTQGEEASGWDDDAEDEEGEDLEVVKEEEGETEEILVVEPAMVDHTPVVSRSHVAPDVSVGVLASVADTLTVVDDENADETDPNHAFGPVVDLTPTAANSKVDASIRPPTSASLAVNALTLEEDFQQDDAMDETLFGDSTTLEAVDNWDDEDVLFSDENTTVQTSSTEPPPPAPPATVPPAPQQQQQVTFSPRLTMSSHVVDHTPSEMPEDGSTRALADPSVTVLATEEDLTRDTGEGPDEEVYDDENEMEYGPVVDQLPQTPRARAPDSGANSLAVHASTLTKDIEEDEKMDESCYGDSTVGGTMEGTAGGGWDTDDPVHDTESANKPSTANGSTADESIAMVDHTPSEMGTAAQAVTDPSVDVVASEGDTKGGGDTDSTVVFGPVVDQTPPTPVPTVRSQRSDSVVVQMEDEDTMVGESTLGDATVDDEAVVEEESSAVDTLHETDAPGPLRSPEDQVVDHVPNRPQLRYGDASTGVAADPSEVLSEVDDMTQEGGNFGPVVDLTPPTRPVAGTPSGAGSTVAFAHSVPADDLDDADETDVAGDEDSWAQDDSGIAEEPNPQSGNDEPVETPVNEQLVDFLPPPSEARIPREALSEMTVGAHSVLQAEDPVEDDFGPVVDQTPTVRSSVISHASTTTIVTASECRALERDDAAEGATEAVDQAKSEVVVDQLPQLRDRLPADSVATAGRSQLTEDEEDEDEDDSKFGPVVDHLPTPRQSLAPSRGGSTVDALATVSEANSDVADGEGWDDDVDVDFDASEGCVSDGAVLSTSSGRGGLRQSNQSQESSGDQERSMSVRFESSINDSAPESPKREDTQYFDPEETQYFDPGLGNSISWDNSVDNRDASIENGQNFMTKSFAEADTPPSTPYRRSDATMVSIRRDMNAKPHPSLPRFRPREPRQKSQCESCDKSNSIACPCVQKILKGKDSNGGLIGTVQGPDGVSVDIDFNKLLEEEMIKRQLLEEECKALKLIANSQKATGSHSASRAVELHLELSKVRTKNASLIDRIAALEGNCSRLSSELSSSQSARLSNISKLQQTNSELVQQVAGLERDCSGLRDKNDNLSKQLASSQLGLSSESAKLRDANGNLMNRVAALESDCTTFRRRNESLSNDLVNSKESILRLEDQNSELLEQVSSFENEKQNLLFELENARDSATSIAQVADAASSSQDSLKAELSELQAKLCSAEETVTSQKQENAQLSSQKEESISELQSELKQTEKKLEEVLETHSELQTDSQNEILSLKSEIATLQETIGGMSEQVAVLRVQHQAELQKRVQETNELHNKKAEEYRSIRVQHESELQRRIQETNKLLEEKSNDLRDTETARIHAENEKEALRKDLAVEQSKVKESESLAEQLSRVSEERDLIQETLTKSQESMVSLQQIIDEHGMEHKALESKRDLENAALKAENENLATQLSSKEQEIQNAKEEMDFVTNENANLVDQLEAVKSTCQSLEASVESAKSEFLKESSKVQAVESETHQLQEDLSQARAEIDRVSKEKQTVTSHLAELGRTLKRMGEEASKRNGKVAELEGDLLQKSSDIESLADERNSLRNERDDLSSHLRDLNTQLQTLQDSSERRLQEATRLQRDKIAGLEDERKQLMDTECQHGQVVARLEQKLDELTQEVQRHSSRASEMEQELTHFRNVVAGFEQQCGRLQEEARSKEAVISGLNQELQLLREAAQRHVDIVTGLEREREQLVATARRQETSVAELEQERDQLIEGNLRHAEELARLEQERDTLQEAKQRHERMVYELQRERDNLENTLGSTANLQNELELEQARVQELLEERNQLHEDNEEMLVQFGLLKEEMDSSEDVQNQEAEAMRLQIEHLTEELNNSEEERKRLASEVDAARKEKSVFEDRVDELDSSRASEVNLTNENERLLLQIRDLDSRYREVDARCRQHEATLGNMDAELKAKENENLSEQKALRLRIEQLLKDAKESEAARLSLVGKVQAAAEERANLTSRFKELNSARAHEADLISENTRLVSQMKELDTRYRQVDEMYREQEAYIVQMQGTQKALDAARESERLLQEKLQLLETSAIQKDGLIASQNDDLRALTSRIANMTDMTEVQRLQSDFSRQEQALLQVRSVVEEKEKECASLQAKLDSARQGLAEAEEARQLKARVASLENALKGTETRLASKQDEAERLASEVVKLESEQSKQIALSLDTASAEAGDVKTMRSHVISLAIALERSETMRADAIERLEAERHQFSESLRRFSESIKRYYSTVSLGEV